MDDRTDIGMSIRAVVKSSVDRLLEQMRLWQVILPGHRDWRPPASLDGRTGIRTVGIPEHRGRQVTVKRLPTLRDANRVDSAPKTSTDWIGSRFTNNLSFGLV